MAKGNTLKEKGTKTKSKKQKKQKKEKGKLFSFSTSKIDNRKTKSITGAVLLVLSIYLLIAFISYLFNWHKDQDLIIQSSFFEFVFSSPDIEVSNWLGKFGAWSAHIFIYKWFGVASFGFCFLLFVLGTRLLLNIRLVPLKRTFLVTFIAVLWFSIALGLFTSSPSFLGGAFGFASRQWLTSTLGMFGAVSLVILLFVVAIIVLFNPDFSQLFQTYFGKEKSAKSVASENAFQKEEEEEELQSEQEEGEEEGSEEFVVKTIETEEEEKEEEEVISTVSTPLETNEGEQKETSTESTTLSTTLSSAENDAASDDDFSIEVAQKEKELTDDDVNRKLEDFGEYDPKLDLSTYQLPPIDLLRRFESKHGGVTKDELEVNKDKIVQTLSNYKIEISKIKATIGPTVTLYEIVPAPGVRISKIRNLEDDIALNLAALGIRIIAPIPGKGTIGIEVPNSKPEIVSMRSLIASEKYQNAQYELPIVLGKTITNETFTFDLTKMPHLLVAGATGQGKSVGLNAMLVSLLYKKHPAQVKFVLVDPKKVELTLYNKIERHFLAKLPDEEEAIITDTSKVVNTMESLCIEMDNRYDLLKAAQARNIKEYNKKFIDRALNPEKGHRYLPYIVVLIDEFADLIMTAGKEIETPIARLAQLARAIGIHLIVATQRPSVNVITGMIKANFPARVAFRVLSKIDSRTILDTSGADQLIGKGDMLISTGSEVTRLQCGFVDTPEVEAICEYIGDQRGYSDAMHLPEYEGEDGGGGDIDPDEKLDKKFVEAAEVIVMQQQGSTSLIQRKLRIGYARAGRIIDQLEAHNIVGPFKGSKARDVLIPSVEALHLYLKDRGIE